MAWQLPYFLFILFVTYRKFSKLSKNMKGKSIYPFNGNDLRHKPLEKSNKLLAPFITTMASDRETRNCQQRKNVNILNRRFKAANHMPPAHPHIPTPSAPWLTPFHPGRGTHTPGTFLQQGLCTCRFCCLECFPLSCHSYCLFTLFL